MAGKKDDSLPGAFIDENTPLPMSPAQAELEMARAICNDLRTSLALANAQIVELRNVNARLRGERATLAAAVERLRKK